MWRLQCLLPLENTGACGRGFSLLPVPGLLQRDGKSRVRERVAGGEGRQRQCCSDCLFEPAGIPQGADQAVIGFKTSLIGCKCAAESADGALGLPCGEQIGPPLAMLLRVSVRIGHGST